MYSFYKERAAKYSNSTGMISADTKWKLSVGEPHFLIAAVSRGKAMIVGKNKKSQRHDFLKLLVIPDAVLVPSSTGKGSQKMVEMLSATRMLLGKGSVKKCFIALKIWQLKVVLQFEG